MSYRLINSNALAIKYPEVNEMPCIYADLPNGLDDGHYRVCESDGEWVERRDFDNWLFYKCSKCDAITYQKPTKYCPMCGAYMEGSKDV